MFIEDIFKNDNFYLFDRKYNDNIDEFCINSIN